MREEIRKQITSSGADGAPWGRYHVGCEGWIGLGHIAMEKRLLVVVESDRCCDSRCAGWAQGGG